MHFEQYIVICKNNVNVIYIIREESTNISKHIDKFNQ